MEGIRAVKPLKICFFLPHFKAGGLEQIILNLIINLDRSRFTPVLQLLKHEGQLLDDLPQDTQVFHLQSRRTLTAIHQLHGQIKSIQPDLMYSGTSATNILLLLLKRVANNLKFKTIISEHTPLESILANRKWATIRSRLISWLYPASDLFTAPIPEICQEHIRLINNFRFSTQVMNNPVLTDTERNYSEVVFNKQPEPIYVAAGRLSVEKNFAMMINSFATLQREFTDARLIILGEGELRTRLQFQINQLGLQNHISMPGYVKEPSLYFKDCTAVISSSDREGFGNTLVEAMQQGTPVISTDCPFGPRHILNNGQHGLLVQMNDTAGFSQALRNIHLDKTLHHRLSQTGPLNVSNYHIKQAVPEFEKLCLKLFEPNFS